MRKLDICLSPDLVDKYVAENKIVVVVDILRATSCMVTALAHGVTSIIPVETLEECQHHKNQGLLAAAERDGKMVDGFDMGNSPFSYKEPHVCGKSIAVTTTNGTVAIKRSAKAAEILIGAFLNRSALAQYLITQDKDVLILCAGWKSKMNLEDTVFAGALASELQAHFHSENDSTIASKILYEAAKDDLFGFITGNSSHYKRLKNLNLDNDIRYCLQDSIFDIIPVMRGNEMVIMEKAVLAK